MPRFISNAVVIAKQQSKESEEEKQIIKDDVLVISIANSILDVTTTIAYCSRALLYSHYAA